ncbi:TonB-dependent receptor [Deltaproteobacteria bacterium]|nr:TonB-dependent receptor [Deltaproteobacteria bacterium]
MRIKKTGFITSSILSILVGSGIIYAADVSTDENTNSEYVFTLGEVVVTAERSAVNLATTVTELSADDIIARGNLTVGEALEQLPGVDVQTGGKGQSFVSIRGFEQRDVKVLIDGVPARESYYGTVDLSMIPTEAISKITVTKGASSVLYGANTMGGVINIITKKGGDTPFTEITTSFGNDGAANYTLNHGGSSGDFNYWLTYGYRSSDGFRLSDDFNPADSVVGLGTDYNEDGGRRDLSDYIKRSVNAKVGYDPNEDSSLYLSFDYHNNERGVPSEAGRYWAFTKWDQWQLNLVGQHYFSDILSMKARAFYVKHDDILTDVSWDDNHRTSRKWFETSSYDDYSEGGEINTFMNLGKWANLKLGFNYLKDNHQQQDFLDSESMGDPGFTDIEEYSAETYTFAIEDEIEAADRLLLVIGLGYDRFKPVKAFNQPVPDGIDTINPQIGAVFSINNKSSLHASVGKKTRFPQLLELYSEHAGGNPDLDPQKTISYEIGASHVFSDAVTGSFSYFYNDISDLIDRERDEDRNWVFYNLYKAKTSGLEAEFDVQLANGLLTSFNYTYMSTEDEANDGRELEGRPEHRLNLDARYRFPFGLTTNFQTSYTEGGYWEDPDDNWTELPGFFLINARLTQDLGKLLNLDSELFLQANNITDYDYYETNGPEPGRNFMAGLTMKF